MSRARGTDHDGVFDRIQTVALRRLDMSFHTIILTMSPIVTMAWWFALFDSRPSLQEAVGGAAVLAGVLLATASRAGLLSRGRSSR